MPRTRLLAIWAALGVGFLLGGCVTLQENDTNPSTEQASPSLSATEIARLLEAKKQFAEKQRHCHNEKSRLELAIKEQQKRNDETQKKLDALLAIDRDIRSRRKHR